MRNTPIACSATAMSSRLGDFTDLATQGMLEHRSTADGLRVRLPAAPGVEQRTRELIAAERRCCPFLSFDLCRHEATPVLDITGPVEPRPIIDEFFVPMPGSCATRLSR